MAQPASSAATRPRLLLLDDDRELAGMVREFLELEGFALQLAHAPEEAEQALADGLPELLILDVMLPRRSGFEILRRLRTSYPRLPVLMLTARGDAIDRVLGLELGADDYLTKPFDPRELAARIRAILRRARPATDPSTDAEQQPIEIGPLRIDPQRRRISAGERSSELTGAELRLLLQLVRERGHLVSRAALTEEALGRKLTLYDRSIDTHVSNLRRKLAACGAATIEIRALRGAGYELVLLPEPGVVNRLSLRIFAGIFAALLLIAAGAVLLTGWIVSERRDSAPGAIAELTRAAREAAERRGRDGLADWLRSRNARLFGRPVFVVDEAGRELLDRPLPGPQRLLRSPRWPVVYVEDGTSWRLVVAPRRARWLGVFSLPEARLPLIVLALLIAGLVSALLARSITRPIADLQRATLALARGDLSAQVAATTRARGDEIGRLGAAFDAMARDLRALVEHRERLLRDVSHELRSPLARMRLAIGLAQQPGADVAAQLARLETEIARLDGLIGAILDVARLESGPTPLRLEPLDLAALLQPLVADARFEAEATGRQLVARGPESLPMDADPHWLGAAIENVLRNALRHAPPGSTVEVELRRAAAPRRAEIEIRDRGPGVPEEALEKIFEPFYRVDAPRPTDDAGVGLGLAIAARSIRAHGGQIVARNAAPGLSVTLSL